jgi:hypothetical protein
MRLGPGVGRETLRHYAALFGGYCQLRVPSKSHGRSHNCWLHNLGKGVRWGVAGGRSCNLKKRLNER